jgi:hypothetical protein
MPLPRTGTTIQLRAGIDNSSLFGPPVRCNDQKDKERGLPEGCHRSHQNGGSELAKRKVCGVR